MMMGCRSAPGGVLEFLNACFCWLFVCLILLPFNPSLLDSEEAACQYESSALIPPRSPSAPQNPQAVRMPADSMSDVRRPWPSVRR